MEQDVDRDGCSEGQNRNPYLSTTFCPYLSIAENQMWSNTEYYSVKQTFFEEECRKISGL